MTIPDEYRTDHLLLLVGTNPLPNWVAARLLLKPSGTLHLLYSDETYKFAERLCEALGMQEEDVHFLRVNPTDAQDVFQQVRSRVRDITGSVGLNYTGGTKAMAVHAYRAVAAALSSVDPSLVCSYLDAADFRLRIDPDWHVPVLFEVQPELKTLAALHGARLREGSPQREADLWGVKLATALAEHAPEGSVKAWQSWCDTLNAQLSQKDPAAVALPDEPCLVAARVALCLKLGLPAETAELAPETLTALKTKANWLGGDWLEHYVLTQLTKIAEDASVHDYGMSLATDQGRGRADFNFEFDVAAMRGYQFFGLSCTTSIRKDVAKQKLFEAYVRARQLGGDEARVGLVCAYEDAYRFEREVMQEWLAKGKIKIFGPQDWPSLDVLLLEWLRTAQ